MVSLVSEILMTTKQAAIEANMSQEYIRRVVREGALPARQLNNGRMVIEPDDLERFLAHPDRKRYARAFGLSTSATTERDALGRWVSAA